MRIAYNRLSIKLLNIGYVLKGMKYPVNSGTFNNYKIELQFLKFFVLILGQQLQRHLNIR